MTDFQPILDRALDRIGGPAELDPRLPTPVTDEALRALPDDRYLAKMSMRVFSAGFRWSVVEKKWPGFEEAFWGFDPQRVSEMTEEEAQALQEDKRIVRNRIKIRATRQNGAAMVAIAAEAGSFGAWLAAWPADDPVGLWEAIGARFSQLGGSSGPYFLRFVGKDTFLLTGDTQRALMEAGVITAPAKGKKARRQVQAAFNAWRDETGWPLCRLSKVLALSVG